MKRLQTSWPYAGCSGSRRQCSGGSRISVGEDPVHDAGPKHEQQRPDGEVRAEGDLRFPVSPARRDHHDARVALVRRRVGEQGAADVRAIPGLGHDCDVALLKVRDGQMDDSFLQEI